MPERPNDTTPQRVQTDAQRADSARWRKVVANAPPVPEPHPPFPTAPPLDTGLADLAWLWLVVHCGCGAKASLPLRRLAADLGWRTPLGAVTPRLSCQKCGARPASIDLTDDPMLGVQGVAGGASRLGNRLRLR